MASRYDSAQGKGNLSIRLTGIPDGLSLKIHRDARRMDVPSGSLVYSLLAGVLDRRDREGDETLVREMKRHLHSER